MYSPKKQDFLSKCATCVGKLICREQRSTWNSSSLKLLLKYLSSKKVKNALFLTIFQYFVSFSALHGFVLILSPRYSTSKRTFLLILWALFVNSSTKEKPCWQNDKIKNYDTQMTDFRVSELPVLRMRAVSMCHCTGQIDQTQAYCIVRLTFWGFSMQSRHTLALTFINKWKETYFGKTWDWII